MIVKKFEAPTENEAVMKAKAELGSQAEVLKTRKMEPRGLFRLFKKPYYEVTVALEEKDFVEDINRKRPTMTPVQKGIDLVADDAALEKQAMKSEQKANDISELLKNQVNHSLAQEEIFSKDTTGESARDDNANVKALKLIYNKLLESEVDEKYANSLINEIESSLKRESDVKSILAGVYQKIILKLGEPYEIEKKENPKVVFFVGPTGVGKTTTIAKIASRLKLSDKKKVALITADTYRISAVEQLKTYAEIIDINVKVVYTPDEIPQAIKDFMACDYILVDTAGRSHKNEEQIRELNEYLKAARSVENVDIDTILVLSATTKYRDLLAITSVYDLMKEYYLLFTKLDETSAYGNILNIRLNTGAGLTYFTMGQNVPEDIEKVNVQWLARQIIGGNE